MAKTSEKAMATVQNGGPDYVVRARQEKNSRYFTTIGAAWAKKDKNGSELISLKLSSIPLVWDGSAILVRPFATEEGDTIS